ncbi:MAG TPA: hypothetical protein VNE62_13040 [Actinomycetota bacterium]|nr:hypothetical protein [Actinomycetota bacterium]
MKRGRWLVPLVVMVLVIAGGVLIASLRSGTRVPTTRSVEDRSDNPLTVGNEQPAAGAGGGPSKTGDPAPGDNAAGSLTLTLQQGVSDREIVVLFPVSPGGCDPDSPADSADAEAIGAAMDYFNREGASLYVRPDNPDGFHGRRLRAVQVPDHGDNGECGRRSREEAVRAMSAHKPFAVVGGGAVWDEVAPDAKVLKMTQEIAEDRYYRSRRPYLWGTVTSGSFLARFTSGYVSKHLRNVNSRDTGDPATSDLERRFAVVFAADPVSSPVAQDLRKRLRDKGIRVDGRSFAGYDPAPEARAEAIRQIVSNLKQDKVTSVLLLADRHAVRELAAAADDAQWRPEWVTTSVGFMDDPAAPRSLMSPGQAANAFGVSTFRPSREVADERSEAGRAWRKVRTGDPPAAFHRWYSQVRILALGIAGAGQQLSPQSFEKSLSGCSPCPRSNRRDPLVRFGPGDFTAVDDGHRQRFDPKRPDRSAPRSAWTAARPPAGAYVYEDDGKRVRAF